MEIQMSGEIIQEARVQEINQQPDVEPLQEQVPAPHQIEEEEEIPESKLSTFRQQEIYNEYKISIRNQNFQRVQELLNLHQKEFDLVNRIDPQSRQISTYLASVIPDEDQALKMLQLLAEHGVNLLFKDQMKQSILFYISREGKTKMLSYLHDQGININDCDLNGQTPVFYAARDNRLDFVKRLIELGCELNHVDSLSSQTALFYSSREGHVDMCKLLMDNGCKPSHQDSQRKTALFYAKKSNKKDLVDLITSYMNRTKEDLIKKEIDLGQGKKKKKEKEIPKQTYKLVYTDDQGNQKELTEEEFENFQKEYPDIAQLLLNADELIDDDMVNSVKDDETWEKAAKKVLAQIWKAKGAYFFHQPVDPKKYAIEDYFNIVKRPMDFGTVKNKLNQNIYRNCQEFLEDVEQVFNNCLLYNGNESDVGKIGVSISLEFKQLKDQYNLHKYSKQVD